MFAVILYKGTYYMCEIETEAQKYERENMDEKGKQFTYWGHKFETYITSGKTRFINSLDIYNKN